MIVVNDRDLVVCNVHGDTTTAEQTPGGHTRWTCTDCGASRLTS